MLAWSEDYYTMKWWGKCSSCGTRSIMPWTNIKQFHLFDDADRRLSSFTPIWNIPEGAYVVCQKCGYRFSVFSLTKSGDGTEDSLRILFLASNPHAESHLDLEEELRLLESELRGVRYRDKIFLTTGSAVRPDDLVRLLRRDKPQVVHFSGHGTHEGIVLRSETGHISVSGKVLATVFSDRNVKLVVLNACFSNTQAATLKKVVGAVVGTTAAVDDEAARRFTVAFYRTIGDGHTIRDAARDGKDAVALYDFDNVFKAYGDLDVLLVGSALD